MFVRNFYKVELMLTVPEILQICEETSLCMTKYSPCGNHENQLRYAFDSIIDDPDKLKMVILVDDKTNRLDFISGNNRLKTLFWNRYRGKDRVTFYISSYNAVSMLPEFIANQIPQFSLPEEERYNFSIENVSELTGFEINYIKDQIKKIEKIEDEIDVTDYTNTAGDKEFSYKRYRFKTEIPLSVLNTIENVHSTCNIYEDSNLVEEYIGGVSKEEYIKALKNIITTANFGTIYPSFSKLGTYAPVSGFIDVPGYYKVMAARDLELDSCPCECGIDIPAPNYNLITFNEEYSNFLYKFLNIKRPRQVTDDELEKIIPGTKEHIANIEREYLENNKQSKRDMLKKIIEYYPGDFDEMDYSIWQI